MSTERQGTSGTVQVKEHVNPRGNTPHRAPLPDGAIVLKVEADRDRFDLSGVVHNRGPETTGDWQAAFIGGVNDAPVIGGRVEALFASSITPDQFGDQLFGRLSWKRLIHGSGTVLTLSGETGASLPRVAGTVIEVDSDTWRGRIDIEHPVIRARKRNLYLTAAFDVGEVTLDQSGFGDAEERVAAFELGVRGELIGVLNGVSNGEIRLRRGVDILGATPRGSASALRRSGSPNFYAVTASLQRYQPIIDRVALFATLKGQYADRSLLSLEEYAAGDATFGRGFDPVEIIGDSGFGGSVELDYSRDAPDDWLPEWIDGRWRAYGFYDFAAIRNRGGGAPGNPKSAQIQSVGGGVQLIWKDRASIEFEGAAPLVETPGTGIAADTKAHFFVTLRGSI